MAKNKQIALRKKELLEQLKESRQVMTEGRTEIKAKLNVRHQAFSLVKRQPKVAFTGSAIVGFLATLLLVRSGKRVDKRKKTRKSMLLGWLILLAKPTAKKWLKRRVKTYLLAQLNPLSRSRQIQTTDTQH